MKKIIVVCGPTASGKTSLAIFVAKKINAEIVSADSMQIYREMNIGTAKPDMTERDGICHHMMDIVSVTENYNVSRYVSDAERCIEKIYSKGKNVILVGGTGLYIDSLINNVNFFEFENDEDYRKELEYVASVGGGEVLADMLSKVDPESASRLHKNDIKRLIRALEVYKVTGKTITQLHIESKQNRKYDPVFVALNYSDRQALYDRINLRVDIMMEAGLVEEARRLSELQLSSTARAAIGYADIFDYFDGKLSYDEVVENIKKKSRNYAKRQITWFNRNKEIRWFYPDLINDKATIYEKISDYISDKLR